MASAQYYRNSHLAQEKFNLVKPAISRKKKRGGVARFDSRKNTTEKIEAEADTRYALFSASRAILFQDLKKKQHSPEMIWS